MPHPDIAQSQARALEQAMCNLTEQERRCAGLVLAREAKEPIQLGFKEGGVVAAPRNAGLTTYIKSVIQPVQLKEPYPQPGMPCACTT